MLFDYIFFKSLVKITDQGKISDLKSEPTGEEPERAMMTVSVLSIWPRLKAKSSLCCLTARAKSVLLFYLSCFEFSFTWNQKISK